MHEATSRHEEPSLIEEKVLQAQNALSIYRNLPPESEQALAALASARSAFSTVIEQTYDDMLAIAGSMLGVRADERLDAVQEAYCRAFEHLGKFRGDSTFTAWLYRIVVNESKDLLALRKKHGHERLSEKDEVHNTKALQRSGISLDPAIISEERERRGRSVQFVRDEIDKLAPAQRAAMLVYYLGEQTVAQTAELLGKKEGAVKVALHRGREQLERNVRSGGVYDPYLDRAREFEEVLKKYGTEHLRADEEDVLKINLSLSSFQKAVVLLTDIQGKSMREAARVFGVSHSHVANARAAARQKISKVLSGQRPAA